jgi:general stress protein 26
MSEKEPGTLGELMELLAEFDTAMLVTVSPDDMVRARPMALQEKGEVAGCDLWFVTDGDSPKVREIAHDRHVGVCCLRNRDKAYLSISAVAEVERDQALVHRLWKPSWKAWFPEGPDGAQLAIIKLRVQRAEYWEPVGGRMRVLYEMAKAAIKGERADEHLNPPKQVQ